MNRSIRVCLFLLTVCLLPLGVRAERIERTYPATADTAVEVRNLSGRVEIQSWSRPEVRIVAMRRTRAVEIHLEQAANRIHAHSHLLQGSAPAADRVVDYEIWAPTGTHLQVRLETGSLRVENFSADVRVETVAASVELHNLTGYISVKTLNGSILSKRCSGRMEATSISGTLRFIDMESRFLVANTTSGDIFYQGDFRPGGSYDFMNHEGSIELVVPVRASFELNANSMQGKVINEFPLKPRRHGRVPQRSGMRSLLGTAQRGDAMVRATSFSGTIRLRQQ